jgi:acetoin utilization protein AcuB
MLTVAEIMTRHPATVSPAAPLREVIGLMKSCGCRELPVVDGERLVGIVTDRDVRLAMNSPLTLHDRLEDETLLRTVTAGDCMTPDPMTIDVSAPASTAADLLKTYKFGGLPIVDRGRLVGIVTVTNILASYIELLRARESAG